MDAMIHLLDPLCETLRERRLKSKQAAINKNIDVILKVKEFYSWEQITNYINIATEDNLKVSAYVSMVKRGRKAVAKNVVNKIKDKIKDENKDQLSLPSKIITPVAATDNKKANDSATLSNLTINDFPYKEVTKNLLEEYKAALPQVGLVSLKKLIRYGVSVEEFLSWNVVITDMVSTTNIITEKCLEIKQTWFNKNRWK